MNGSVLIKKGGIMEKVACIINSIGILLLLAAAFDVLPLADNLVIFLAIACFIIGGLTKKITKGTGSCCSGK